MKHFIYRARRNMANWLFPNDLSLEPNKLGRQFGKSRNLVDTDNSIQCGAATDGLGGLHLSVHRADAGYVVRLFDRESEYSPKQTQTLPHHFGPSLHIIGDTEDFGVALSRIITMRCLVR